MKQLTKREDQIIEIIWRLDKVFIRDIVEEFDKPRPHYNTIATLVKILVKKGLLKSEVIGVTNQYSVTKEFKKYRKEYLKSIKRKYFEDSFPKMMTFFAKQEKLSDEEISELINLIKQSKS